MLRAANHEDVSARLNEELTTQVLALTIPEREAILRALDDPPDGLCELRGVLLREHEWRVREGLV